MRSKSIFLITTGFLAMIVLSGCGLIPGFQPADPDQGSNPLPPAPTAGVADGTALLKYTYKVEQAPIFKLEVHPEIPITIENTDNESVFTISGITEAFANLEMMGVGGEVTCMMYCEIPVRYAVTGKLEYDDFNDNCKLDITILRTYQEDEAIIQGGCPDNVIETFDCVALANSLVDPNNYVFTKEIRELHMPSASGVELYAILENVVMPRGLEDTCDW